MREAKPNKIDGSIATVGFHTSTQSTTNNFCPVQSFRIYLAGLEDPTEIQRQLSTTKTAIAVAGTTAILGLLDDDEDKEFD